VARCDLVRAEGVDDTEDGADVEHERSVEEEAGTVGRGAGVKGLDEFDVAVKVREDAEEAGLMYTWKNIRLMKYAVEGIRTCMRKFLDESNCHDGKFGLKPSNRRRR
jgi:hypothetical protein